MNRSGNRYKPHVWRHAALALTASGLLLAPSSTLAATTSSTQAAKPAPPVITVATKAPSKPTKPTKPAKPTEAPVSEPTPPAPEPTPPPAEAGAWKIVPGASLTGDDFDVLGATVAVSSTQAWAVGSQRSDSGEDFTALAEQWTGSAWKAVPTANLGASSTGSNLDSLSATGPSDVWAVGSQSGTGTGGLIEHWNGTSWSAAAPVSGEPAVSDLEAVSADSTSDVWAVGVSSITTAHNSFHQPLIEHFNGSSWSVVEGAFKGDEEDDQLIAVEAVSPSDVWAIGTSKPRASYSGAGTTVVEHYNGSAWSIVGTAETASATHLRSITGLSADDLWAAGEEGGSAVLEHYNGSAWSVVPGSLVEGKGGLGSVTELSPTDVWAVGRGLTEHWNGTSVSVVASQSEEASLEARVEAVSGIAGGPLFAVGSENGGNDQLIIQQPNP
jgi:hypothetical protein